VPWPASGIRTPCFASRQRHRSGLWPGAGITHAQTLLAELRDTDGRRLPRYVDRELAEYLRCGILSHGFARVRCQACNDELLVA
jgi:hypothetical protein